MSIVEDVKSSFKNGDLITKIIFVNIGFFVVNCILMAIDILVGSSISQILPYLIVPSDISSLMLRPWTLFTYMFMHVRFIHIALNMLTFYWFAKIFNLFYTQKQMVGLYVIGGLFGALIFVAAYNLSPNLRIMGDSMLLGASASVMALVVASAFASPNYVVRLALIGNVSLKWIALAYVFISIVGITSSNVGGELSHLGGALAGYVFASRIKRGKDMTAWVSSLIDKCVNLFSSKGEKGDIKVSYTNPNHVETDYEYNARKKKEGEEINRILDKIKKSGYDSLSDEERKMLFGRK